MEEEYQKQAGFLCALWASFPISEVSDFSLFSG
jgi:hypothetical protein